MEYGELMNWYAEALQYCTLRELLGASILPIDRKGLRFLLYYDHALGTVKFSAN